MSEIKNVIIIGAGGNLGPSILNAFLASSAFNTTVLSREDSKSTFPANVKVIRADYTSSESLTSAFKGQDAVVSLVGGMALGDQKNFIDAAIAAGVQRFLPSEYGVDTANPQTLEIAPIMGAKNATVEYLRSKEDQISWTSIQTGAFFDWGLMVGFLGFDAASKTATFIDEGKGAFTTTNLSQVGEAVVKVLSKPSETKNQYVRVSSFATSQAELLPAIEKATGGEKWTVKNISSEELRKRGNERLAKQDFGGIGDLIQVCAFSKANLGDLRAPGLWNDKLGLSKADFEASVQTGISGKLVGQ
ncbi:isoflavone reductase family protein-like protein CipA [Aaosphaeria arxii CBS 175.79]|uniref:Isoflavone reductase family protein-like protein CipA n=1 Tax=Aaosphaeria arxii CBS 175.79 TaxID=1450172 RepID=A0A6A5XD77_9PLEO|nr:isoflavone reductase family protein-like protein CipA [Aaosphaeria arxii CBS 175.79]KAF2010757.1 isoflavone reductase family protein-like protein CipA [Aaosphaeria arxii CBS 175.79]